MAYLGSEFFGSQIQPHHRTVEGEVLKNLGKVHGENYRDSFELKAAGRTDAGVNALGNVMCFSTRFDDDKRLLRALNGVSKDVYYLSIAEVPEDFNPRFADERTYRYVMPKDGVDLELAEKCAKMFEGKHDFRRFCKLDDRNPFVNVREIIFETDDDNIILTFKAQFFLWNMIRRLSAAVMSVGKKEHTLEDVKDALDGKDIQFGLGRPDALTLVDVHYPNMEFQSLTGAAFDEAIAEELFALKLRYDFLLGLKK